MQDIQKLKNDFQVFVYSNNIVIAAASWSVGMATKEFITALLSEIVFPIFVAAGRFPVFIMIKKYLEKKIKKKILQTFLSKVGAFSWMSFIWLMTILLTFVILEFFLNRKIVGIKSEVKEQDKNTFEKAKVVNSEEIKL